MFSTGTLHYPGQSLLPSCRFSAIVHTVHVVSCETTREFYYPTLLYLPRYMYMRYQDKHVDIIVEHEQQKTFNQTTLCVLVNETKAFKSDYENRYFTSIGRS